MVNTMEDIFKPSSLSIRELFCNADSLYRIPEYQRPYKWQDEQVTQLWDDIDEAYENGDSNYFLGSIVTAKDDPKSGYFDVVDGQQRLTTLMILFCVIRDVFPDLNKDNITETSAIHLAIIESSITLFGQHNRLKIVTHSQHQSDFNDNIIKINTNSLTKPLKSKIRKDEEPKYKFINTACIFREKLSKLERREAENLIDFLFNQVKIIRIDCKDKEFAIKLFQVINDRGMDLTASDLIKSFLLQKLLEKYKGDDSLSKEKEEQFISDWQVMEQIIKNTDINLNDLFIIYQYYVLGGQVPKKSVSAELQEAFKEKDPNEIISDIKKFAEIYAKDIVDNQDKVLYSFRYIPWNMYWKSILVTALHTKYADYEKLKIAIRRFYYLYWIAGNTLSKIKQMSFNVIQFVKENKPIAEIITEIENKISGDKVIDAALQSLTSNNIADVSWVKPLLLIMEYNYTDNVNPAFIDLNRNLHLEHILPQKYEKSEWVHITDDNYNTWINSAGNLTLLSGAKNIEASNNPFNVKINVYKGKGKYSKDNNKITAFQITQDIVKDYDLKTFNQQWTVDAMIDRWKWFFTEIGELLDINVENEINKHQPELEQ